MTADLQPNEIVEPWHGLLWGYRLAKSGASTEIPANVAVQISAEYQTWLHFNLADARCKSLLSSLPGLEVATRLLNTADVEPQFQCDGSVIYGAIADLRRDVGETRDHVGLLHFIKSDTLLITARRGPLFAPGALREILQRGTKFATIDELFAKLLDQVLAGADQLCEALSKRVDKIEDRVVQGTTAGARPALGACRRSAISLHRHVYSQRMLHLRLIRESSFASVPEKLVSLSGRMQQDCEALDREILSLLDRIMSLQDEVSAALAEETNNNLRIMSILTILFLPPTFVTGLFGMNLKDMLFGESAAGFWYGTALAVSASVVVAWILRRIGILGKGSE